MGLFQVVHKRIIDHVDLLPHNLPCIVESVTRLWALRHRLWCAGFFYLTLCPASLLSSILVDELNVTVTVAVIAALFQSMMSPSSVSVPVVVIPKVVIFDWPSLLNS